MRLDLKRITVRPVRSGSSEKFIGIQKSGAITFSFAMAEHFGLTKDMKAVFFQDQENLADWYLGFGEGGDYALKEKYKYKGRKNFQFSNSALRDKILESLGLEKRSIRLKVADEPIEVEGKKLYKLERSV